MPEDDCVTSFCPFKIKNSDDNRSTLQWTGACKIRISAE
jgi:hypothetical protein